MSVSTDDLCYDCGEELSGGGEPLRACLWNLPGVGAYWEWVRLCSRCASGRRYRRARNLVALWLVVSTLTALAALAAYRLL